MIKKLNKLKENEIGIIKKIDLDEQKRFKLSTIGLQKGSEITYKFKSVFSTPIAYQINGCVFAMREEDASKIEVEV